MLVMVDADRLGSSLKWEPSRGGALFPHLYAPLDTSAAAWVQALPDGETRTALHAVATRSAVALIGFVLGLASLIVWDDGE
jgi:uncharacterized protein (DUF952 family)